MNIKILTLCLIFPLLCHADLKGTGTQNDPFLISSKENLRELDQYCGHKYANNFFLLTNDIEFEEEDFKKTPWAPIGKPKSMTKSFDEIIFSKEFPAMGDSPSRRDKAIREYIDQRAQTAFHGIFDGDGHTIRGLKIGIYHHAQGEWVSGLFGLVYKGTIKNLRIDQTILKLDGNSKFPKEKKLVNLYAGAICGLLQCGYMENCHANVLMDLGDNQLKEMRHVSIGGLIGEMIDVWNFYPGNSVVKHLTSEVSLKTTAVLDARILSIGGIVGEAAYSLKNVSSDIKIDSLKASGLLRLGGIIGSWPPSQYGSILNGKAKIRWNISHTDVKSLAIGGLYGNRGDTLENCEISGSCCLYYQNHSENIQCHIFGGTSSAVIKKCLFQIEEWIVKEDKDIK